MNLLDLISADGFHFKKVAATRGGEYSGPCPFCGGDDRFRIWPRHLSGRYWCRGCHCHGDAIQYLRDKHDLTFAEACDQAGITPRNFRADTPRPSFTPRELPPPPEIWEKRGREFLSQAQKNLWREENSVRAFLISRGLTDATIRTAGLGWNETDSYFYRETWGLSIELKSNGKVRRLWLPSGLVIPCFDQGRLIRLRVRRFESSGPRYVVIPGSSLAPLILNLNQGSIDEPLASGIVESELDAWLIWQEAGALITAMALGSASMRPDTKAHTILKTARLILVALDADDAGAKESWKFWPNTYGEKIKRWPVPIGKDPSEAYQQGLDIRAWIEAGLSD